MKPASGRKPASLLSSIWEILSPAVILWLSVLGASVAVMGAAGLITGVGSLDAGALLAAFPQLPQVSSACGYALALATLRPSVRYDELRFGNTITVSPARNGWRPQHTAVFSAAVSLAGLLWSRLLLDSPLPDLFTGYSKLSAVSFEGRFPLLLFLSYVVLGPIAEELAFRCCVFRRLRTHMSLYPAILLSSVLFGLWHGNVIQFLYASVLGLMLAWGYEKSGRISVCLTAHICANLCAFIYAVLSF